jgi:hypothetical protein
MAGVCTLKNRIMPGAGDGVATDRTDIRFRRKPGPAVDVAGCFLPMPTVPRLRAARRYYLHGVIA